MKFLCTHIYNLNGWCKSFSLFLLITNLTPLDVVQRRQMLLVLKVFSGNTGWLRQIAFFFKFLVFFTHNIKLTCYMPVLFVYIPCILKNHRLHCLPLTQNYLNGETDLLTAILL